LFSVVPIPTKPERFFHDGLPHPLHPYIPKQTHNTNTLQIYSYNLNKKFKMNDDADHKIDPTERTTEIVITKKIKTDHRPQTVKRKSQYHDFECTKENIKNEIDRLRIDEIGLKLFQKYLNGKLTSIWGKPRRADLSEEEKDRCGDTWNVECSGYGGIVFALMELEEHMFNRVALITDGLDTNLTPTPDLKALRARVEELFGWYESEYTGYGKYIGPYFPLIQSSGMGKTRLLMELRNLFEQSKVGQRKEEEQYDCFTILCEKQNDKYVVEKGYYDGTISLRDEYCSEFLYHIYPLMGKATTKRVVLLFDEAHNLLEYKDGYAFLQIRWHLRLKNSCHKIVAVFAGTTLNLTHRFVNDSPPGTFARDPKGNYWNYCERRGRSPEKKSPKQMYPPFFYITTIGSFGNRLQSQDSTELEKAAYFGRPLFASLQTKGELLMDKTMDGNVASNSKLYVILTRMVLSAPSWQVDDRALYSILGTRIQMGVTLLTAVASDLVKHAYATLIFFDPIDNDDKIGPIARVAFLPDPVCAALAMGLMVPEWELQSHRHDNASYKGQDPKFWSRKAMDLFHKGFCTPAKGDGSEVMVALYMLFCGDGLRMKRDPKLHTFSVSLLEWYMKLKHPTAHDSKVEQEDEARGAHADADKAPTLVMEVNFMQVCRNFFCRNNWNNERSLEWMYKSAVASYMFSDQEEIDLVCAIRLTAGTIIAYLPLLVSVKCWKNNEWQDVDSWIQHMKYHLDEVRKKDDSPQLPALCLFVVVGVESVEEMSHECNVDDLANFPNEDVFRVVVVPKDDPFDISTNLNRTSMTEVYISHCFNFY
jgi:hypothetical protein